MCDSPRSEKFDETRFSTPVSELDDHRHQPSSLPRADTMSSVPGTRRGTASSITIVRPDMGTINDMLVGQGVTAADFEHAIVEDDASVNISVMAREAETTRRASLSPSLTRGSKLPRSRHSRAERPRTSSMSSRSTSPPNSVEAFAGPRRRERTNTANSKAPSALNSALKPVPTRSTSRGSRKSRRTFRDARRSMTVDENRSDHGSAEDDVCFPPDPSEEEKNAYVIDFEDLEDLVAERNAELFGNSQSPEPAKVFSDLRPTRTPSAAKHHSAADVAHNMTEKFSEIGKVKSQEINRWTFFSSEIEDPIHAPELGDLLLPGESFRHLFKLARDGGFWWLDMENLSEMEVQGVAKAFHLHPLTREDIVQQEAREKVELFRSYYFVCFRSFVSDKESDEYLEPLNVYAVIFREGVLSFTYHPNAHAANVRRRLDRLRDHVEVSPDWICYALIDDIVDGFEPVIREVEHETDAIEDSVFTVREEDFKATLLRIGQCRRKVMGLLRLVGGKADVIKGFAKRCNEQYSITPRSHVGMFLSDVQDHVVTFSSNLSHFEKILSRSHSNYLAQISVDNIAQGNKFNRALGKVTFVAGILVPLNLVCGLFGMNVPVPGREATGLGWFFGILGGILAFAIGLWIIARRLRYI